MRSSTSNSKNVFQRELPSSNLPMVVIGTFVLCVATLGIMEYQIRKEGGLPSRALNISFWLNHRFKLDERPKNTTVLLGASRMTFGLDQDTWEEETGTRPHNLGLHGASCIPMLHDYAKNTQGNGIVLCALSGGFAFANERAPFAERINHAIRDLDKHRYSLSLRSEDITGKLLQARIAVLNPRLYSPTSYVRDILRLPARKNEIAWRHIPYAHHTEENQDVFINDIDDKYYWNQWDLLHATPLRYMERFAPLDLDEAISLMKKDIKLIEDRGGKVIFVRFPISRFFVEWENTRFPREQYWDRILASTGCHGFHFLDHDETKDLSPLDGSHLLPEQARIFTKALARFVKDSDQ